MRTLTLLLCCLFFVAAPRLSAQEDAGDGIVFSEKSFDDLLAQAKEENKVIFIDAYTTWCGPCKMMSANIFPDARVGEVYNDRFINAKIDMEKGEGPALAQRYSVQAYPTYLFVNGDGELVHKGLGYIPVEPFLALADAADGDRSLLAMNRRYDGGERDADFVQEYAEVLTGVYEEARADQVIGEYLDGQEDWSASENLALILASPGQVGDKRMIYLTEHADDIEDQEKLVGKVQMIFIRDAMARQGSRKLPEPEDMKIYYAENGGQLADRLLEDYRLIFFRNTNDKIEEYLSEAMAYYAKYPSDDFSTLNSVAWTFFEEAEDPDQLAQAIKWAERSVELYAYYPNLDTLAWLYQKTGQREKAVATAKRAIDVAKAEGLDYSDTEQILELE